MRSLDKQIAACAGVYRASDVARYFGVSKNYVYTLWSMDWPDLVCDVNIWDARPTVDRRDVEILRNRGLNMEQISAELKVSVATLYRVTDGDI